MSCWARCQSIKLHVSNNCECSRCICVLSFTKHNRLLLKPFFQLFGKRFDVDHDCIVFWSMYELCPGTVLQGQKLAQVVAGGQDGGSDVVGRTFVGFVLDFDAHWPSVAHVGQGRKKRSPADVAQARQFG